jgi:hypothetical protein
MSEVTHVVVLKSERFGLEVFLCSSEKEADDHRDDLRLWRRRHES